MKHFLYLQYLYKTFIIGSGRKNRIEKYQKRSKLNWRVGTLLEDDSSRIDLDGNFAQLNCKDYAISILSKYGTTISDVPPVCPANVIWLLVFGAHLVLNLSAALRQNIFPNTFWRLSREPLILFMPLTNRKI